MSKPVIHVPLDQDELALMVKALHQIFENNSERRLREDLSDRLKAAFAELLRESGTAN